MQYRRAFIPAGSFFFTLITEKRRNLFGNENLVALLRQAFRKVKEERPFDIERLQVCLWVRRYIVIRRTDAPGSLYPSAKCQDHGFFLVHPFSDSLSHRHQASHAE